MEKGTQDKSDSNCLEYLHTNNPSNVSSTADIMQSSVLIQQKTSVGSTISTSPQIFIQLASLIKQIVLETPLSNVHIFNLFKYVCIIGFTTLHWLLSGRNRDQQ